MSRPDKHEVHPKPVFRQTLLMLHFSKFDKTFKNKSDWSLSGRLSETELQKQKWTTSVEFPSALFLYMKALIRCGINRWLRSQKMWCKRHGSVCTNALPPPAGLGNITSDKNVPLSHFCWLDLKKKPQLFSEGLVNHGRNKRWKETLPAWQTRVSAFTVKSSRVAAVPWRGNSPFLSL